MTQDNVTSQPQKPPFGVFLAATVLIFFLALSTADSIGFVPDYIDGTAPIASREQLPLSDLPTLGDSVLDEAQDTAATVGIIPERIVIPAIDMDLAVQNPSTRDINALDALLVNGPARYIDSAKLGEVGNMIIFAHSSHLPIVHNAMYKAFNRVPELSAGDMVTLQANGKNYLYSVTSITTADASNTKIDMSTTLGTRLTLVTCDTLTGKSARFVLEASYVGSYDI
ncbi:MAG: sortase [Candidatus Paceibacterota bacterium]